MADTNIITQADVQAVKAYESTLAQNLTEHANASLSKAHGFELLNTDGLIDSDGNDVSLYHDSNGDLVGTKMLRITDPNSRLNYVVPLNVTTLAGQPASTGVTSTADTGVSLQGDCAWITDVTTEALQSLQAANIQLLLPHTQLSHWQTHTAGGVYSIAPQNTRDSAGHLVAEYVASIVYKGKKLLVPCSLRVGGPRQTPHIIDIAPRNYSVPVASSQTYAPLIKGDMPFTYSWYYSSSYPGYGLPTTWTHIPPTVGVGTTPVVFGTGQQSQPLYVNYDAAVGILTVVSGGGGGLGVAGWFRLEVSNLGGTVNVYDGTSNYAMVLWINGYPTN